MSVSKRVSAADKKTIAEGLGVLLADSYILYLKTQNYHWNVTGPSFQQLHKLFEEQYTDLASAIDEIAERIRALGYPAPGAFAAYTKLSKIKDETGHPKAEAMIKQLVQDNETITGTAHQLFPSVSDAGDEASADLLTRRMTSHEKNIWMLRSLLE